MESVLKKFLFMEFMFTIMELLLAEQKGNIFKMYFIREIFILQSNNILKASARIQS